jgi:hypothetical protein
MIWTFMSPLDDGAVARRDEPRSCGNARQAARPGEVNADQRSTRLPRTASGTGKDTIMRSTRAEVPERRLTVFGCPRQYAPAWVVVGSAGPHGHVEVR